jgi:hypothetical protein
MISLARTRLVASVAGSVSLALLLLVLILPLGGSAI